MPAPVTITAFRQKAGPLFSEAIRHHAPLPIQRGTSDLGFLLGADEISAILDGYGFTPKLLRGDGAGGVSIWLPELGLYGQGETHEEAKEDLLGEVRIYVDEYMENADDYTRAPNRAGHLPYIIKAYLADWRGQLASVVFPGPPSVPRSIRRTQAARGVVAADAGS